MTVNYSDALHRARAGKILLLAFLGVFVFFILVVYPSVGDFDYWHMKYAFLAQLTGHTSSEYATPGFSAITVFLSESSNIGYSTIPTLPLQLLPFMLAFVCLARRIVGNKSIYVMLALAYFTYSSVPEILTWDGHELGEVMFLILVFASLMILTKGRSSKQASWVVIMIVALLSLNLVSYKLTMLSLVYLVALQLFMRLQSARKTSESRRSAYSGRSFTLTLIIGSVFVFAFNQDLYNHFIPTLMFTSGFSYSIGTQKLLTILTPNLNDPLQDFYRQVPGDIAYAKVLWLLVMALCFIVIFGKVLRKMLSGQIGYGVELIFLAMIPAATVILLIYNSLGLVVYTYFILATLFGCAIILRDHAGPIRRIVILSVVTLLLLNVWITVQVGNDKFYDGQRDPQSQLERIDVAAIWYANHGGNQPLSTDVFSAGCYLLVVSENTNSTNVGIGTFTRNDLLWIVNSGNSSSRIANGSIFLLNYQEDHFVTMGWGNYKSWKESEYLISDNTRLNSVFSTGSYVMYITNT
jgi:hypothetical protein